MNLDQQIVGHFVCAKCKLTEARAKRFAATGTGLSKLFDIQHNIFVAVSCQNCGYTELYNPDVLERRDNVSDVLDVVFGG